MEEDKERQKEKIDGHINIEKEREQLLWDVLQFLPTFSCVNAREKKTIIIRLISF